MTQGVVGDRWGNPLGAACGGLALQARNPQAAGKAEVVSREGANSLSFVPEELHKNREVLCNS